jgi:hypothetical protein
MEHRLFQNAHAAGVLRCAYNIRLENSFAVKGWP